MDNHDRLIRAVRKKPRAEWPREFQIRWDFSPERYYLAEDGARAADYTQVAYQIGEADLEEIDANLHGASRRSKSELWTFRPDKVAEAIVHWSTGGLMTPPMLEVSMGCLVIVGGNNRMAVCRADGVRRLPFLYKREQEALLASKLESFVAEAALSPAPGG